MVGSLNIIFSKHVICSIKTYRESFLRINFYHSSEQVLTIGRYKVGYVKVAPLDFFQELSEIVIVERKGSNQQGIQNHTARPHICPSAIVLLPLEKKMIYYQDSKILDPFICFSELVITGLQVGRLGRTRHTESNRTTTHLPVGYRIYFSPWKQSWLTI